MCKDCDGCLVSTVKEQSCKYTFLMSQRKNAKPQKHVLKIEAVTVLKNVQAK